MTNIRGGGGCQSRSQAQKYHFWVSFVNHNVSKRLKIQQIYHSSSPLYNALTISLIQKQAHIGERWYKKSRIMKNLFLYLNKRTILEHLIQEEHSRYIQENSHYIKEILLKIRYFERLLKSLKKVNFSFFPKKSLETKEAYNQ